MNRAYILLLFTCFTFLYCSDSGNEGFIDPAFQSYVDKFIAEAALRGDTLDSNLSGLSIIFEENGSTTDYAGVCRDRLGLSANEIGIERGFWNESEESAKEWLIFHELGHCVLDRDHDNQKLDNGMWKSLMRGGTFSGIDSRIPLCYIWERQEYYIDELFDPNVAAPDWVKNSYLYSDKPQRGEELISLDPGTETFDNYLITPILNFELEYTYVYEGGGFDANIVYGDGENIAFHFVSIDHVNNEISFGNEIQGCMRFSFDNRPFKKVTIRQKEGTTSLFVNEEFIHSYASYENPINRFRSTGDAWISFQEFKLWSIF